MLVKKVFLTRWIPEVDTLVDTGLSRRENIPKYDTIYNAINLIFDKMNQIFDTLNCCFFREVGVVGFEPTTPCL